MKQKTSLNDEWMIVVRASKLPFSQHNFMQEKFVLRVFNECLTSLLTCFTLYWETVFNHQSARFWQFISTRTVIVYCSCYILSKYTELSLYKVFKYIQLKPKLEGCLNITHYEVVWLFFLVLCAFSPHWGSIESWKMHPESPQNQWTPFIQLTFSSFQCFNVVSPVSLPMLWRLLSRVYLESLLAG